MAGHLSMFSLMLPDCNGMNRAGTGTSGQAARATGKSGSLKGKHDCMKVQGDSNTVARVGMVFSGGPAPGANAVIAAAGSAFRRAGAEVIGILRGYTGLHDRSSGTALQEGVDYRVMQDADLRGMRNQRGVWLGTARVNPGREVNEVKDLDDATKTSGLARVYHSLCELELDALISIGGDGTLRTANLLYHYQKRLPPEARRVRIVHLPKTIDN